MSYKINKPIRLIELFAGIGAQAKALENLNANFEHYRVVEFDKFAIQSYNAIHHTNFTTSDITKIHAEDLNIVDTNNYEYIMTYSFPCQDLSLAGKKRGMTKGNKTRSGLLWEVERLLNESKELPQILLMENVIQVHNQHNNHDFEEWQHFLESLGYKNYWKDLNAKDYNLPQSRKRCFMVSILNSDEGFKFPEPQPLEIKLNDLLETKVDEKYYLSEKLRALFLRKNKECVSGDLGFSFKPRTRETDYACTITTRAGGRVSDNFILENEIDPKANEEFNSDEIIINREKNLILTTNAKIRKLTPKECFRLMGFDDVDVENCINIPMSNTQLFKQAGNSICVNVLENIFKQLL